MATPKPLPDELDEQWTRYLLVNDLERVVLVRDSAQTPQDQPTHAVFKLTDGGHTTVQHFGSGDVAV